MVLLSEILAFKLLKQENLSNKERLLVLTGMNHDDREIRCVKIIKFKGDQFNPSSDLSHSIKFDPAFFVIT